MNHSFEHIDDFDDILDDWSENAFRQHISHFFKPYELLFGLVEIATLKNRTGVGDIYIYTDQNEIESGQRIRHYRAIINKVQSNKKINLSEYKEWYKSFNHYYIYTYQNEGRAVQLESYKYNCRWWKFDQEAKYPFVDKENVIERSIILDYLNYYADLMHNDFRLSKYPFYAILIKPISFPVPEKHSITYPVGTFYLHFATAKPVPKDKFKEFINQFFIVWLKDYGVTLIEEFTKITPAEDRSYIPPFSKDPKKVKKLQKVEPYLREIYIKHKSELECDIFEVCQNILEHLIMSNKNIDDALHDKFHSIGLNDLLNNMNLNHSQKIEQFRRIMIQREVFKLLLLDKDYSAGHIHKYFVENDLNKEKKNTADKLSYFWVNRFIPIKCKSGSKTEINKEQTILEIKRFLSEWEKTFIRKYIELADDINNFSTDKKLRIISGLKDYIKS